MSPLDTSGMGALRVEASIFGESALIDRVCCDVVVFVKVSASKLVHFIPFIFGDCSLLADLIVSYCMICICVNVCTIGNGKSLLAMRKCQ